MIDNGLGARRVPRSRTEKQFGRQVAALRKSMGGIEWSLGAKDIMRAMALKTSRQAPSNT